MKQRIHVVAHTHWDFEWYFSRQESQIQLLYHMDEVFKALETNQLSYYVLDGQMAIVDDFLDLCPEKRSELMTYIKANRLFIGPWYTQVDELTTSGESMIRNLQLGINSAEELGGAMNIGYLPDSFGQSQDIPKIYNGFGIHRAIFWRGMPKEKDQTSFYWESSDGSKVLATVLKNGYYVGASWIESNNEELPIEEEIQLLPVGGDQRAVDRTLNNQIEQANQKGSQYFIPSHYEAFFDDLENKNTSFETYTGEFIDPSVSKIHRGIYDSRADIKQLYDGLERLMVYQVEPLMILANQCGLESKLSACKSIWKTIARGQAHDSAGACNSDKTNRDIYNRGICATQQAQSLIDIMLRKMGQTRMNSDLCIWNTELVPYNGIKVIQLTTHYPSFQIYDKNHSLITYTLIKQEQRNKSTLRRDKSEEATDIYYVSKVALMVHIDAMDWQEFIIEETKEIPLMPHSISYIENEYYRIECTNGILNLYDKKTGKEHLNFLFVEDSGDDGDNYDYSPPRNDWTLHLDFKNATIHCHGDEQYQWMTMNGYWKVPLDLNDREHHENHHHLKYRLEIHLTTDNLIRFRWVINNSAKDHRLRMVLNTDVQTSYSVQDTPFGITKRPWKDRHLNDWQEIGYKEEPTCLYPFIHFTNLHDNQSSWTFYGLGEKSCQQLSESMIAVTLYRSVGYLGKPDLIRRPGDASGLQNCYVETPDSQLLKTMEFSGAIAIDSEFNPNQLQNRYISLQPALYYQNQDLNEYTTPTQYFQCHPASRKMEHHVIGHIDNLSVVVSSITLSEDNNGWILRLYNSSSSAVDQGGVLELSKESCIYRLDLNNKVQSVEKDRVTRWHIPPFKSGEIQTFAIYPLEQK